ncbi:MAG: Rdx family protein [Planctomycetes bacterium]|nr:Rdx family protein [Planctomycetota bacterium]
MAATIKKELDVNAELVKGEKGIYEITVDGQVVYSRGSGEGFPDDMHVVGRIREHTG